MLSRCSANTILLPGLHNTYIGFRGNELFVDICQFAVVWTDIASTSYAAEIVIVQSDDEPRQTKVRDVRHWRRAGGAFLTLS